MKVGDLVIVRLEETGTTRFLLSGIIVNKILPQKSGKKRQVYEVLTRGETVFVSDSDLGPINMFSDKKHLEEKWNDV